MEWKEVIYVTFMPGHKMQAILYIVAATCRTESQEGKVAWVTEQLYKRVSHNPSALPQWTVSWEKKNAFCFVLRCRFCVLLINSFLANLDSWHPSPTSEVNEQTQQLGKKRTVSTNKLVQQSCRIQNQCTKSVVFLYSNIQQPDKEIKTSILSAVVSKQ